MKLTLGERERLKSLFNLFLAAQRRCSEITEVGRTKKAVYSSIVMTIGYILGDDGQFEKAVALWESEIKSFGVIKDSEIDPERN